VTLARAGTRVAVAAGPLVAGIWIVAWLWRDGRGLAAVVLGALLVVALESMLGLVVAGLDRDLAGAGDRHGGRRLSTLAALPALGAAVALWRGAAGLAVALGVDAIAVAVLSLTAARLGRRRAPGPGRSRDALG
jgi:hypothetical protein